MTDITRRNLGKLTIGIAATGAASTFTGASSRAQEAPNVTTSLSRPAEIPASRGPRAVVVGDFHAPVVGLVHHVDTNSTVGIEVLVDQ